LIYLNLKKK